ncbi:MAG: tRNA (N(6)-L-threonylcarbamoyladenosine(37)-C(2))-methylthiotransferase MtaB, partial [Dehalococcoidia bacterium]|nr:tRNA (N(6)-L-threonylcarbamoyladenosine(37)-C(2))-methylthiotransferase MtaB [Dehalococcoidia bacterium]
GCKLNLADSEILSDNFQKAGFDPAPSGVTPTVYILNTCTVTHIADRKSRQLLRAARRRYPSALIVATGCYAQRDKEALTQTGVVDIVAGNESKPRLVELVKEALCAGNDLSAVAEHYSTKELFPDTCNSREPAYPENPRAFVKIQEGCNDVCSYCIIPKVRGPSRHFSLTALVEEVRQKEARGCKEIVLTGTQLGDYGLERPGRKAINNSDTGPLVELLKILLDKTSVPRIRISSLQPQDISPKLLEIWNDPRMCRHFHMALQSGSNTILRAMRRRYTVEQFAMAVQRIRRAVPNVSVTTDVMVGYPGETEVDFEDTYQFCDETGFAAMHLFPYSRREGTAAAKNKEQVDDKIKKQRVDKLLALDSERGSRFLNRMIGLSFPVLWEVKKDLEEEGVTNSAWTGLTDNYIRVYSKDIRQKRGEISATRLVSVASNDSVWGEDTV